MIALFYYLLKVILCSGILYGYYHLALRNKVFHEWNRFYLLAIIALSVLLPLLDINIIAPADHDSKIISAMQLVAGADEYITDVNINSGLNISWEWMTVLLYAMVSITILTIFTAAIIKITNMIKKYTPVYLDDVLFLNTKEHGTPFSFFKYLLWNDEIPPDSENGKRIMEHELVHIREKHSWDKIFVHISLVVFWINPFFWLIRKELAMIHEFIADRKTVGSGDVKAFAKLILQASFPQHANLMANSFFQSSIKRRLAMINKQNNPRFSYLSRLMMIPVLFVLVFAFGVKAKTMLSEPRPSTMILEKKYNVVIDAGHGGADAGAVGGSLKEKDIALSMALLIKSLSNNPNINIILTRTTDVQQPIKDKTIFAEQAKADLFVSLHVNSSQSPDSSGIMTYISAKNVSQQEQNIRFATLVLHNLSGVYKTDRSIRQRTTQGVWVLDANKCPAAIIECGFISNKDDRAFISRSENQKKMAEKILSSIEEYFSKDVKVSPGSVKPALAIGKTDTITPGKKKTPEKVTFLYLDGGSETLTIKEYRERTGREDITFMSDTIKLNGNTLTKKSDTTRLPSDAVYLINGHTVTAEIVNSIDPSKISSMNVTKKEGKQIIDITLKESKESLPAGSTAKPLEGNAQGITIVGKPAEVSVIGPLTIIGHPSKAKEGSNKELTGIGYETKSKEGSPTQIRLKGINPPPLYIIDGKESTPEEIEKINPDTIASIDVLKDANAKKFYGDKGKNGVIVVTLKK